MTSCRIQHPNAVRTFDFGVTERGIAYLVMELLEGRSVTAEVQESGPLPLGRALSIAATVADVLAAAHAAGIVHRDVKPDNVFLHRGPEGEVVKVVDFGIAKLVGEAADADLTHTGGLIGTPSYTAPERLTGRAYDGRADVYSLGLTLYAMLAGRGPFTTDLGTPAYQVILQQLSALPPPLRSQRSDVPEAVERLLMRSLAKDPADRPTAGALAEELRELLARLPDAVGSAAPPMAESSLSTDDTLQTLTPRGESA
jgi:serine/threonine protein kinase